MGLDIFFSEDIRNALQAADEASSSTARVCATVGGDQATSRAYLEGYRAALTTVALAFGLSPAIITGHKRDILEVEARAVGEALPAGGEDDTPPSTISYEPSAMSHQL
jgi:hypothetical protein